VSDRYLSVAATVAWRHLRSMSRTPALWLPPMIFPLFFYAAFAGGLSAVGSAPGFDYPGYNTFQFAFVLLQSAVFGGVFIGFSIGADFDSGITRRLFLAAPNRSAVVAGYGLAALARTVAVWAVVLSVALATGVEIGGNGIDLVGLFGLAALVNVTAFLFAAGMMLRFRTIQAGPAIQIPAFMILMTAPVYVPRALLDGWVDTVAQVNPVTAILEAERGLVIGEPVSVLLAFAATAGLLAAFALFALRGLRRAEAGT
jgi:ABC-2 type transport system permease protein